MNEFARLPVSARSRKPRPAAARRPRKPKAHYYAFLSYSHKDEELADWLHQELEDFHVPAALAGRITDNGVIPKRLKPIFRDEHELAAADDLGTEIRSALAASQFLIVLCSPAAATSHWTNAEIETFKRSRPDGCILAAIAEGEPFASDIKGREDEECFPPALREKYDRRGRPTGRRAEPLAADLRGGPDERRMGFLKLVAGMLGVGLDDLVQRETTRRQRRMAWITASSLLGMLFAIGLAVFAIQARDAARDQRREAEGLVEYMLGDLRTNLEPIGKLGILDGVGSRILAYYSRQDTSELSDQGLAQRSRALTMMGEIADDKGNLDAASKLFRAALQGTEESMRRAPDDPKRIYDHAQNVFYLGDLARRRGQMAEAETAYREYDRLAKRMSSLEPDNLRWRLETAYGASNIGIILRSRRQFDEAAEHIQSAVQVMEGLAGIEPGNPAYQDARINTLGWLADAERDRGRLAAAIAIRTKQIDLIRWLLANGSDDANLRARLVPAQSGLALLFILQGRLDAGLEQLQSAVSEAEQILAIEPANTTWRGFGAQARLELASTLLKLNRLEAAAAETRIACDWSTQVLSKDAKASWRYLQTTCLSLNGRLALERGDSGAALDFAQRAVASAQNERNDDAYRTRFTIAGAYKLVGDVHRQIGDASAANSAWAAGYRQLPSGVAERPAELELRAQLLQRVGRRAEAQAIVARLQSFGAVSRL